MIRLFVLKAHNAAFRLAHLKDRASRAGFEDFQLTARDWTLMILRFAESAVKVLGKVNNLGS